MKPLVVLDADVLGRQRTGDETYVENLLRRLPAFGGEDFRFAALTRRPDLVPDGVEPVELQARFQDSEAAPRVQAQLHSSASLSTGERERLLRKSQRLPNNKLVPSNTIVGN